MFLQHFNLAEQPFGATPDPRFLFQTAAHREALASLYTGFMGNRGFTVLIAEPGMGKTTLLFEFLDHIRGRAKTAFLFDTLCEPKELLSLILQDLGISPAPTAARRHRQLNDMVAAMARSGRRVVVVIDEAQNLSADALEAVRLLTNFETTRSKLLQVVLAGQPQLAEKLMRPELSQLRQRVSTVCQLTPLTSAETAAYIVHRLRRSGCGKPLFSAGAVRMIADASRGVPRIINTLCFNSLCLCRARGLKSVDQSVVAEAIGDLDLPRRRPERAPAHSAAAIATPFTRYSEVRSSSATSTLYIAAGLLAVSIGALGAAWASGASDFPFSTSLPAVLPHTEPVAAATSTTAAPSAMQQAETVSHRLVATDRASLSTAGRRGEEPQPTVVAVAPGDTLARIATRELGEYNGAVLQQILALNPHLLDPDHIESGRNIRLPARP